MLFVMQVYNT